MKVCFSDDDTAIRYAETLAELLERKIYLFGDRSSLTVSTTPIRLRLLEIFHPSKEHKYVS